MPESSLHVLGPRRVSLHTQHVELIKRGINMSTAKTAVVRGDIIEVPGQLSGSERDEKFALSLKLARKKNPDCAEGDACVLCGKRVFPVQFQAHRGPGGGGFMPVDEQDYDAYAEMGWWSVGPDCARKFPKGYIAKVPEQPA